MSDAMKLTDFPLVTSLDTTDTVIATDSTGAGKRISKTNLKLNRVVFSNISSPTWVRVAKVQSSAWALMKIFTTWNLVPGNNILVDMQLHPNSGSYNNVTVLSRTANQANTMLQKMRVVRKNSSVYYIDIYYNATTAEQVYIYLIDSLNVTLLTPEPNAEIPEDYTAVEFDISKASWGGVKRCATNSCKLQQKGGQRDGRSDSSLRITPRKHAAQRLSVQGQLFGSRCRFTAGYLHHQLHNQGYRPSGHEVAGSLWHIDSAAKTQHHHISVGYRRKRDVRYPYQIQRGLESVAGTCLSIAGRKEVVAA